MHVPLTRLQLDYSTLGNCECCGIPYSKDNPFELGGRCHKHAPVRVAYWQGVLQIHCSVCERLICEVAVSKS